MSRHPYTYSCDYIRGFVSDYKEVGGNMMMLPTMSRSQASQIRQGFAKALKMSDEQLAILLSNIFMKENGIEPAILPPTETGNG